MPDRVRHLVAPELPAALGADRAAAVLARLRAGGILAGVESACLPEAAAGYAPGPHCAQALAEPRDARAVERLQRLAVNGVLVRSGRMVYHGSALGSAGCPHCGKPLAIAGDPRWFDAVEQWLLIGEDADEGLLLCTGCTLLAPVTSWPCEPAVGFGCLGLSFWNWPPLAPEFVAGLEALIGAPLIEVGD